MKTFNIYEAKANLSKLIDLAVAGEEVVIARAGRPVADLKPYKPKKNKVRFGAGAGKLRFKDEDFVGLPSEPDAMPETKGKGKSTSQSKGKGKK
jgi:prevent-host-death family protein